MNIKERFPDETSLREYISKNIDISIKKIRDSVGHLEAEYIKKSHQLIIGIVLAIGGFVVASFPFYSGVFHDNFFLKLPFSIFGGYLVYISWNKIKGALEVIRRFNLAFNKCAHELVFNILQVEGEYLNKKREEIQQNDKVKLSSFKKKIQVFTNESPFQDEIISFLDESELITENRNQIKVDDSYIILIGNKYKLRVTELDVKNVTGSGKNRHVKEIFTGLFAILDLPKDLDNKTFVSTEGDKRGFANQSFLNQLTGSGAQLVDLEWNDFENLLHVVSTSQTEARYILTPDFMNDLYQWWKEKKLNIRFAFIRNHMYLMFPDQKIHIDSTVRRIEEREVIKYMESVAIPLLYVLHVVEDIEERFMS